MVLRQLKMRGVKNARLFVGDGNLGLWAGVGEIYPHSQEQLCWNHKMLNVMDAVSKKEQVEVKRHLNAMMYAESRQEALQGEKEVRASLWPQPQGGKDGGGELGSADNLLRFSPRALEAPADIERGGVSLLTGEAENRSFKTV